MAGGRIEGPHIRVPRRVNTDGEALAEPRFALVIPVTEDLAGLSADYHGWRGRRSGRACGRAGGDEREYGVLAEGSPHGCQDFDGPTASARHEYESTWAAARETLDVNLTEETR
ncbi:hypothetical protein DEJ44_11410 [Streptomyces venezuelae]|nr:hypothetical protein DEJ44_11410 [Streptomyces venezuelae]